MQKAKIIMRLEVRGNKRKAGTLEFPLHILEELSGLFELVASLVSCVYSVGADFYGHKGMLKKWSVQVMWRLCLLFFFFLYKLMVFWGLYV